jgi:hypothetical protein
VRPCGTEGKEKSRPTRQLCVNHDQEHTHIFRFELDESKPAGLALERSRLVEHEIEFDNLPEFTKYLDEGVSCRISAHFPATAIAATVIKPLTRRHSVPGCQRKVGRVSEPRKQT